MTLENAHQSDVITLLDRFAAALHGNLASYICSWSCLWSIKLSFMVFFHGLGRQIRSQQILWWGVLCFIAATYIICISLFDYGCLTSRGLDILGRYPAHPLLYGPHAKEPLENCSGQDVIDYEYPNTRISTTFDIVTDVLSKLT